MRPSRLGWIVTIILLNLMLLAGCGSVQGEADSRLEHHTPAHKPANFADAIQQLRVRNEHVKKCFLTDESGRVWREVSEILDILGWLPELAADSPMKKPEWDRVLDATSELVAIFQNIDAAARKSPRGEWPAGASKRIAELEVALSRLVSASL